MLVSLRTSAAQDILSLDDSRTGSLLVRVRRGMREDIRWEADNIALEPEGGVRLVGEDIQIGVFVVEEEAVLQCAVDHSDVEVCQSHAAYSLNVSKRQHSEVCEP